jgi:hypothetical protein
MNSDGTRQTSFSAVGQYVLQCPPLEEQKQLLSLLADGALLTELLTCPTQPCGAA